jgi:chromosome segregation ATPase
VLEESSMIFGLVRKSRYEQLQRQVDELNAYMKILTSEMEKLRKEDRELRNEIKASKQKISQLQGETNNLRFQRQELANFVEILTKERGVFQQIIQNLSQSARKQKQTRP